MNRLLARCRSLRELAADASGHLVTEWALVTATVLIPLGSLAVVLIRMLDAYFYRYAGVIALPFP